MDQQQFTFLKTLLDSPGPSSFETLPARIWRAEAERFADRVSTDVSGNSFAVVNPEGSPRIMLAGHIDEIGVMVTFIDDNGYLSFEGIGGWDPQVFVGQRVFLLGRDGPVPGVIGKRAIHLMEKDDRDKVSKPEDLWIDIGASSRAEAVFDATTTTPRLLFWRDISHLGRGYAVETLGVDFSETSP